MSKTNMKRIHKVTIKRMWDTDPDTSYMGEYSNNPDDPNSIDRDHDEDCPRFWANDDVPDDARECDCRTGRDSQSYQYFNPSSNYKGEPQADIRKYTLQDYARMEALNNQQWGYIGIRASARVQLTPGGPLQDVESGGLWGIESDSDADYLKEVEGEELSILRAELHAMGFSQRAISAAYKDVEHREVA